MSTTTTPPPPPPTDPNAQPPAAATTTTATAEETIEEPRKDLDPRGYSCNDCGITFRTPEELEAHKKKNESEGKKGTEHIQ